MIMFTKSAQNTQWIKLTLPSLYLEIKRDLQMHGGGLPGVSDLKRSPSIQKGHGARD